MKALLVLEDGRFFEGTSFGASGERFGEVVFNTGMTGYQEVLTDPSYKGQIVAMTYPLIGNYGINEEDLESRSLWLEGFVIRELSSITSNWRSKKNLATYLEENDIIGIQGIDTRALTRHIRTRGAMKAVLSTVDDDIDSLVEKACASPGLEGIDLVSSVTCEKPYMLNGQDGPRVVVMDFGVKQSILNQLRDAGCNVTVLPAHASIAEIMEREPGGILLSNGPGDPDAVQYAVATTKRLLEMGTIPIFGICLGQQILGLALGGRTYKLKFGHHGSNQPVKCLKTGKIDITVQNHGFCVDIDSLDKKSIEMTHINLSDNTLEGIEHKELPAFSVQFHPEAGPGPHDARYLFRRFVEMIKSCQK
ncbi:MAG: glutamine-hydrolyzing carbamoyl-phosphate synthase small subunit [Deltaproteobacteria bacterium]|nr:glutamine-hydrolyzing carbamoyl-phosphate synthase small subunit [Deltaproteobacteria bacterium]